MAGTGSPTGAVPVIRDDEVDAFFKLGDEGTYAGGPHSIQPVSREGGSDEDNLAVGVSTEQLERRDRMKRFVTKLVGALGAGVMVLLPFKLGAFGTAPVAKASAATPRQASLPVRPVPAAVAAAPAPITPAAVPVALPGKQSVTAPAPKPVPTTVPARVARRTRTAERSAGPATYVARRSTSSLGSVRALPPTRATHGAHVPPTATFPD